MPRLSRYFRELSFVRLQICVPLIVACLTSAAMAQQAFTWEQIKGRFEAENPTLRAGKLNIDESKADEITAYLRP